MFTTDANYKHFDFEVLQKYFECNDNESKFKIKFNIPKRLAKNKLYKYFKMPSTVNYEFDLNKLMSSILPTNFILDRNDRYFNEAFNEARQNFETPLPFLDNKYNIYYVSHYFFYDLLSQYTDIEALQREFKDNPEIYDFAKKLNKAIFKKIFITTDLKDYLGALIHQVKSILQKFVTEMEHQVYIPVLRGSVSHVFKDNTLIGDALFLLSKITAENKYIAGSIKKWFKEFGLPEKFEIRRIAGYGSEIIFLDENDNEISLKDMGFGYSQLLPIIIYVFSKQLYATSKSRKNQIQDIPDYSFLIEEPESHLHPEFQSKLADMFLDALNTSNNMFIIETHSEYLIRKLQYLIAAKKMNINDIAIYYLGKDPTSKEYITKIELDENGMIKNEFGAEFFDEAAQLITNLWDAPKGKLND